MGVPKGFSIVNDRIKKFWLSHHNFQGTKSKISKVFLLQILIISKEAESNNHNIKFSLHSDIIIVKNVTVSAQWFIGINEWFRFGAVKA